MKATWFSGSLPWFGQELDKTRRLMGANFYSCLIEPNRKRLKALFQCSSTRFYKSGPHPDQIGAAQ